MVRLALTLTAVAVLFAGCGPEPFEGTGKVYEHAHRPERWETRLTTKVGADNQISVTTHQVRISEWWALDLVDEYGKEHRVRVHPDVWSACSVGDWYSTNTGRCS